MQLLEDMDSFYRRLRLRNHFFDDSYASDTSDNESDPLPSHKFKKKSSWQPKSRDPTLECFIKAVNNEIETFKETRDVRDNLSKHERLALESLQKREDIIIKEADKGSAVVVMNKSDYIDKALEHLSDTNFYNKLDHDPTSEISEKVTDTIHSLSENGCIDDDTYEYLIPEHPTAGLPSYVKDTTDFLNKLDSLKDIPNDSILVSLDVKGLYTNIPHDDGITACKEALDNRTNKTPSTDDLINLLELTLKSNNFVFNDEHYLQTSGTAMGAKFSPSYANIFMGWHEGTLFNTSALKPLVWYRYIDDIFMIWTHSKDELEQFINHANQIHPSIKFTSDYSPSQVNFLDVAVKLSEGQIHTDLYSKPTDKHTYLLPTSCHPRHCTRNIPYSLALRLRRICSDESAFQHQPETLKQQLINRGYQEDNISNQITKAASTTRENSLKYKIKSKSKRVPLVVTYHPRLPHLSEIIRKQWHMIETNPRLHKALPEVPLISYKRPPNLRKHFVKAKVHTNSNIDPKTDNGCKPCQKPRCKNCAYMQVTSTFSNKNRSKCYTVRQEVTCSTNNVVYLIECANCNIQYVGETGNNIRERMRNHR
ncbi:uncharacterized protein [Amphiura filiformis]|uniref:uncharacterized protein n=1 Tax=Amphiura filiformis TaxID=82378 RepID=UPI003B228411